MNHKNKPYFTRTYRVDLKVKQLVLNDPSDIVEGCTTLTPNGIYHCHRVGTKVYVYGGDYGTELTIKQAKKILEYVDLNPVSDKALAKRHRPFSEVDIFPLVTIKTDLGNHHVK